MAVADGEAAGDMAGLELGLDAADDEAEEVADEDGGAVVRALLPATELTVESCSWMSIMWSPRRMVRFRGALPR